MDVYKILEIVISVLASTSFLIAVGLNDFKKYKSKIWLLALIIIPFDIALIYLNLFFLTLKIDQIIGLWFIITIFLPELILLIILLIIGKVKIKFLPLITSNLNAFLCFYMMFIMKQSLARFFNNPNVFTLFLYLVSSPIFYLYLHYIYRNLQLIVVEYMPKKLWLLTIYTFSILAEIVIYAVLLRLTDQKVLRFSIFNVAILSVYFVSIFGFYIFLNDYKNKSLQLVSKTANKKQLDMIISYVKKQKENENKFRIIKHDMRHVLNNIASLIQNEQYDDALEVIKSYNVIIDSNVFTQYCEDPIINAIINYFSSKCEDNKIPFTIKINNFEDGLKVPPEDISLLISNILDNAYNAASVSENPFINFKFLNNKGRLVLQVTNRFSGKIQYDSDNLPTSKNQNHGVGTKSIQYYAKKNNLFVDYQIKENTFRITILFNE